MTPGIVTIAAVAMVFLFCTLAYAGLFVEPKPVPIAIERHR